MLRSGKVRGEGVNKIEQQCISSGLEVGLSVGGPGGHCYDYSSLGPKDGGLGDRSVNGD